MVYTLGNQKMNLELRYNKQNRQFFITRELLILLVIFGVLITLGLSWVFLRFQDKKERLTLQTPDSQVQPVEVLGTFTEAKTPEASKAADLVIAKIKQQYSGKFNLVFFYDGYQNQDDAMTNIKLMEAALDIVEPFKSLKELITYKVFTTEGKKCNVVPGSKKLLSCDRAMVDSFNRLGIEHFKLVVLSPLDFTPNASVARGKNSAIYIPTLQGNLTKEEYNRWIGQIFTHELGHSLGLRDEYSRSRPPSAILDYNAYNSPSSNIAYQPAEPNCAPDLETAKQWWGNYTGVFSQVGFYPGCAARDSYYYPEEGTLMSAYATKESYGQVSEDYLRAIVSCFYGNKEAPVFPAGFEATYSATLSKCESFKAKFPNFWEE